MQSNLINSPDHYPWCRLTKTKMWDACSECMELIKHQAFVSVCVSVCWVSAHSFVRTYVACDVLMMSMCARYILVLLLHHYSESLLKLCFREAINSSLFSSFILDASKWHPSGLRESMSFLYDAFISSWREEHSPSSWIRSGRPCCGWGVAARAWCRPSGWRTGTGTLYQQQRPAH